MLRRRSLIALALVPVALLATGAYTYRSLPPARLTPSEGNFDLGDVPPNAEVSHTFDLSRAGYGPLRIREVVTQCGCLDARVTATADGWSLVMRLKTDQDLGPQSASATVETDEPSGNVHSFQLTCNVVSPASIDPLSPDFGVVELDQASTSTLDLAVTSAADAPAPVVSIVDQLTTPTVRIVDATEGNRYTLGFDRPPVGPLTASVRLDFPGGTPPSLLFPIRGLVVGDTYASPFEINLDWRDYPQPVVARAEIHADQPPRIDRLFGDLADNPDLTPALIRDGDRTFFEISIRPGPRTVHPRTLRGLALLSAGPDRISLPVSIHVP